MSTHTFDQLISATNRLAQSVLSGANMAFCLQGGDHTDSGTISELQWWSQVLNGGPVSPNTGKAGIYEGVQRSQNKHVWQPDSGTTDAPSRREFPRLPGVLDSAVGPFVAEGLNVRWLSVYGNHDRIFSGMFGKSNALHLDRLADMLSSGSTAPVTTGSILRAAARAPLPARFRRGRSRIAPGFGSVEITADPAMRRTATAKDFATVINPDREHDAVTWWSESFGERVQVIGLDTSNRADGEGGRIGPAQTHWLEEELRKCHSSWIGADGHLVVGEQNDRIVVVVSHHNSSSMDNHCDDSSDPGEVTDGAQLIDLLHRYPNVVIWLNGHSHEHRILPHKSANGGFWEVSSASVTSFPQQGRLFEIFDNQDGTVSIFTTVFDHAGPPSTPYCDSKDWTPSALASLSRELAANDDQWHDSMTGLGRRIDRNVELIARSNLGVGELRSA